MNAHFVMGQVAGLIQRNHIGVVDVLNDLITF